MTDHKKYYFVFTDKNLNPINKRVNIIVRSKLGWPYDSLLRYHMFYNQYDALSRMDYLFFFNANMIVNQKVFDGIIPVKEGLISVVHSGFYNKSGIQYTYETNPVL